MLFFSAALGSGTGTSPKSRDFDVGIDDFGSLWMKFGGDLSEISNVAVVLANLGSPPEEGKAGRPRMVEPQFDKSAKHSKQLSFHSKS